MLGVNEHPTEFPGLNEALVELTTRAAEILGANFVGAYLQGSFAVGDADVHSDVDFIIPTVEEITAEQEAGLREMHAEFPERDAYCAQHLEGSYPPAEELRTLEAAGRDWLYIDNGHKVMERSPHCNTAVVRRSLREFGVTLAGPAARSLIDEVGADDLRAGAVAAAAGNHAWLREDWNVLDNAWTQPYVVTTFCRILETLDSGRVTSKLEALLWGIDNLDPQWSGLIRQALDDRPDPWERTGKPARPGSIEPTERFAEYAEALCFER